MYLNIAMRKTNLGSYVYWIDCDKEAVYCLRTYPDIKFIINDSILPPAVR